MTASFLVYAFLGGLLPSCIWLYFLLREDAAHPEPKRLIALAFVAGALVVPLALPLEQYVVAHYKRGLLTEEQKILLWALIEEFLKYGAAFIFIFWRRAVDEIPDYVIYMITVALGFAAAETMLFIYGQANGSFLIGSIIGNERFLGSALLHVVASAAIGFALAFTARGLPLLRMCAGGAGLILAIALHAAFNVLIMNHSTSNALFLVWIAAIIFLAVFEVLKYFQYRTNKMI